MPDIYWRAGGQSWLGKPSSAAGHDGSVPPFVGWLKLRSECCHCPLTRVDTVEHRTRSHIGARSHVRRQFGIQMNGVVRKMDATIVGALDQPRVQQSMYIAKDGRPPLLFQNQ